MVKDIKTVLKTIKPMESVKVEKGSIEQIRGHLKASQELIDAGIITDKCE